MSNNDDAVRGFFPKNTYRGPADLGPWMELAAELRENRPGVNLILRGDDSNYWTVVEFLDEDKIKQRLDVEEYLRRYPVEGSWKGVSWSG